ncbi:MAG: hypothetical protein KatS3mg082_2902 [Nitrospiraceae bacterium]|nr:MAG: hypothetical protein KatS3mg082_2902 [Nitrospiraceae bacterium]
MASDGAIAIQCPDDEPLVWSQRVDEDRFAVATPKRVGICHASSGQTSWTECQQAIDSPRQIQLSPSGQALIRAGQAFVLRGDEWMPDSELPARKQLTRVVWFPDGKRLLAGHRDGSLRVVSVNSWRETDSWNEDGSLHASEVVALAVAADSQLAAVSFADRQLALVDLQRNERIGPAVEATGIIRHMAFEEASGSLVTADPPTRWSWTSGRLQPARTDTFNYYQALTAIPGQSALLSVHVDRCCLLNSADLELRDIPLAWDRRSAIVLDRASRTLTYTDWWGRLAWIKVDDVRRLLRRSQRRIGRARRTYAVAYSADGNRLFSVGDDGNLRIETTDANGDLIVPLSADQVTRSTMARERALALVISADRATWRDLETGDVGVLPVPQNEPLRGQPRAVALTPDGRLAAALTERDLLVWDIAAGKLRTAVEVLPELGQPLPMWHPQVTFGPRGHRIAIVDYPENRLLACIYSPSGELQKRFELTQTASCGSWSPDLQWLAVGTEQHFEVRQMPTLEIRRRIAYPHVAMVIWPVDESGVILIDGEHNLAYWDFQDPESRPIYWGKSDAEAKHAVISSSGRTLLLAETSGHVSFWQIATGRRYFDHNFGHGPINHISVTAAGYFALQAPSHLCFFRY